MQQYSVKSVYRYPNVESTALSKVKHRCQPTYSAEILNMNLFSLFLIHLNVANVKNKHKKHSKSESFATCCSSKQKKKAKQSSLHLQVSSVHSIKLQPEASPQHHANNPSKEQPHKITASLETETCFIVSDVKVTSFMQIHAHWLIVTLNAQVVRYF